jgi:fused signal recognition particle receptor
MEYVILGVVLAAVVVGALSALLVGRRGRKAGTLERPRTDEVEGTERGDTTVAERPTPTAPPEVPVIPPIEAPEPTRGRLVRLRGRLARSQNTLGKGLLSLLSRDTLDDATWEEIEDTLLAADVGVSPTQELVERLRTRVRVLGTRDVAEVRKLLGEELLALIGPDLDRTVHVGRNVAGPAAEPVAARPDSAEATATAEAVPAAPNANAAGTAPAEGAKRPAVALVVGVNGTGKTTTTGKLARVLIADGHSVVLGAADTFRAAAAEQLQTWGDRVGAHTVRRDEGADPASVAFDAVVEGAKRGVDAVIIDTAGRLHTKAGLMDELGKVKRVVEKKSPIDEVLLVLDATTGQNGLVQARVFSEVVNITGIVLTKLDGTAKGGIVVAVQRELGVPVKLIGLGEGPDDLAPFDPQAFVDALIGD